MPPFPPRSRYAIATPHGPENAGDDADLLRTIFGHQHAGLVWVHDRSGAHKRPALIFQSHKHALMFAINMNDELRAAWEKTYGKAAQPENFMRAIEAGGRHYVTYAQGGDTESRILYLLAEGREKFKALFDTTCRLPENAIVNMSAFMNDATSTQWGHMDAHRLTGGGIGMASPEAARAFAETLDARLRHEFIAQGGTFNTHGMPHDPALFSNDGSKVIVSGFVDTEGRELLRELVERHRFEVEQLWQDTNLHHRNTRDI